MPVLKGKAGDDSALKAKVSNVPVLKVKFKDEAYVKAGAAQDVSLRATKPSDICYQFPADCSLPGICGLISEHQQRGCILK